MTSLPASGSTGTLRYARSGTLTSTMSPACAASAGVAARARGPSSSTSSLSVSGPRELLSTTSYPAATASLATVPPMCPLPISPTVVMSGPNPAARSAIPGLRRIGRPGATRRAGQRDARRRFVGDLPGHLAADRCAAPVRLVELQLLQPVRARGEEDLAQVLVADLLQLDALDHVVLDHAPEHLDLRLPVVLAALGHHLQQPFGVLRVPGQVQHQQAEIALQRQPYRGAPALLQLPVLPRG